MGAEWDDEIGLEDTLRSRRLHCMSALMPVCNRGEGLNLAIALMHRAIWNRGEVKVARGLDAMHHIIDSAEKEWADESTS